MVLDDQRGNVLIYLEHPTTLESAIHRESDKAMRTIKRDKIGEGALISFDETNRILLFCSVAKVCA